MAKLARWKSGRQSLPKSLSIHPSIPPGTSEAMYNDKEVLKFFSSASSRLGLGAASKKLHLVAPGIGNFPDVDCFPLEYVMQHQPSLETVRAIHRAYPEAIASIDPSDGQTVLHRAMSCRCSDEVVIYLIKNSPPHLPITPATAHQNTPIHLASRSVYPPFILEALIQKTLSVDMIDGKNEMKSPVSLAQRTTGGFTALHLAILSPSRSREDKVARIQLLLQADPRLALAGTGEAITPNMLARSVNRDSSIYRPLDKIVKVAKLGEVNYKSRHELDGAISDCNQYLLLKDKTSTTTGATAMTADTASLTMSRRSTSSRISTASARDESAASTTSSGSITATSRNEFAASQTAVAKYTSFRLASQREKVKSLEEMDRLIKEYAALLDDAIEKKQWRIAKAQQELIEKLESKRAVESAVSGQSAVEEASSHVITGLLHNGPWKATKLSLQFLSQSTNNYDPKRHLGTGGFGSVYRGVDPMRGTTFAVKKIKEDVVASPFVYERVEPKLFAEIQKLSELHHPNIVRLLGYHLSDDPKESQCLVYELAGGGSLSDILKTEEGRKMLNWRRRVKAAKSVASALVYLHSKGIFHRDIKPGNICFSDDFDKVIVIDYGIAIIMDEDDIQTSVEVTSIIGTDSYMAPEYKDTGIYGVKCDVFSFGVVLRTLVSGNTRLRRGMNHALPSAVDNLAGDWDLQALSGLQHLIGQCCASDPKSRPQTQTLHDRLEDLDRRYQPHLNRKEKLVIEEELTKSRMITGRGVDVSKTRDCRCGRKNVNGLRCLRSSPHFSCNSCFSEHLVENMGESQILCREPGCNSDPYTLDQIKDHSSPALFAEHLMRNRNDKKLLDDSDRKLQKLIAESVKHGVDQALRSSLNQEVGKIMRSLELIGKNELACPNLCFLVPTKSSRGRMSFMSLMQSLRSLGQTTVLLYFVCAYDKTPMPKPIMLYKNRAWLKVAVPLVKTSILIASLAVQIQGLPVQIPIPGGNFKDQLRNMDALMSQFVSPEESFQIERYVADSMRGDSSGSISLEATKLKDIAYHAIKEVADENHEWRQYMDFVQCKKTGEFAWVHKKNAGKWANAM